MLRLSLEALKKEKKTRNRIPQRPHSTQKKDVHRTENLLQKLYYAEQTTYNAEQIQSTARLEKNSN